MFKIESKELDKFAAEVANDTRAIRIAAEDHVSMIQDAFDYGGADQKSGAQGAWKETIKFPAAEKNEKKTLQKEGALVASIQYRPVQGGYEVGPAPFVYAPVHQFGESIKITAKMRGWLYHNLGLRLKKSKTTIEIPARPYIVFPDPWQEAVLDTYTETMLAIGERKTEAA